MLYIDQIWEQYFTNHHEGLGSTYERFILHRYFEQIREMATIDNVLEAPSFGMTGVSGINSLWWAANGVPVTVIDSHEERVQRIRTVWEDVGLSGTIHYQPLDFKVLPFEDKSFDLCWNFAALWFVPDAVKYIQELARIARKVVLICIPNTGSVFYFLRRKILKDAQALDASNIHADDILKTMREQGWHLHERGFLDVPPWPDIAMNKEDLLKKIGLKRLGQKMEKTEDDYLCILDYFNGKNPNMEDDILKYDFLENSPRLFQKMWSHHQYFIFLPETPAS